MNGYVVTTKNFLWIKSKLVKFFDKNDLVAWHNFNGGMKRKHIPPYKVDDHIIIYRYKYVQIKPQTSLDLILYSPYHMTILLDYDNGITIRLGDVVKFYGNRVHIRTVDPRGKYLYSVFQKIR